MKLTDKAEVTLKNRTLIVDIKPGVWVDKDAFDNIQIVMRAGRDLTCSIDVEIDKRD